MKTIITWANIKGDFEIISYEQKSSDPSIFHIDSKRIGGPGRVSDFIHISQLDIKNPIEQALCGSKEIRAHVKDIGSLPDFERALVQFYRNYSWRNPQNKIYDTN